MKIVFANRRQCFSHPGGDTVQMLNTKAALEKFFDVEIRIALSTSEIENTEFDLLHIFNFQTIDESTEFANWAMKNKIPFVISSVFWDLRDAQFVEFLSERLNISPNLYMSRFSDNYSSLIGILQSIRGKSTYSSIIFKKKVLSLLQNCSKVLPNSVEEVRCIENYLQVSILNFHVVFNAVDEKMFRNQNSEKIRGIISVARLEPLKNQINLVQSMLDFPEIPILLIGSKTRYKKYLNRLYKICEKHGNVEFIDNLAQPDIFFAMNRYKVHAMPSFRDSPGLSSLEAMVSGSNIIISNQKHCPIETYFIEKINKSVFVVDPYDVKSIRRSIFLALNAENASSSNSFTWKDAATQTMAAYKSILGHYE